MSWNITKDEVYAQALEAAKLSRLNNLRHRKEHLNSMIKLSDDALLSEFEMAAPIWAKHRKDLDQVATFLMMLREGKRFTAHKACLSVWAYHVAEKPCSAFHFLNPSVHTVRHRTQPYVNNLFNKKDPFEVINGYLALDPFGCLAQPDLLSGTWISAIEDPKNRDAAILAILSAVYRYGKTREAINRYQNETKYSLGGEVTVRDFIHGISLSTNCQFREILHKIPDFKKGEGKAVRAFYSAMIDKAYSFRCCEINIPYAIKDYYWAVRLPDLLNLALKANLLSTPAHGRYANPKYVRDREADYCSLLLNSPYITGEQLINVVAPQRLTPEHWESMQKRGIAVSFVNKMDDDCKNNLIAAGKIPMKLLNNHRDRGRALETSLGL
jgi:hypothetical protein